MKITMKYVGSHMPYGMLMEVEESDIKTYEDQGFVRLDELEKNKAELRKNTLDKKELKELKELKKGKITKW